MDNITIERLIVDTHNFNEKTLMSNCSPRNLTDMPATNNAK